MPFKFKLSRRLALLGSVSLAIALSGLACDSESPSSPDQSLEIIVVPQNVTVGPGEHVAFEAMTRAPDGSSIRINLQTTMGASYAGSEAGPPIAWSASGGIIDPEGRYAASPTPGQYMVIASVGAFLADTGYVTVTGSPLVPVASVTIEPASATLEPGASLQLTAALEDSDGNTLTGRAVTWASDAANIAGVSASGVVTGQAEGEATITATSGSASGSAVITVSAASVEVASVVVTPDAATLAPQATVQLTAELRDADGEVLVGRSVAWSSDLPGVATVSSSGLVTGASEGVATIAATSDSATGSAVITVSPASVAVTSVVVTPNSVTLAPQGTAQLTAELKDDAGNVLTGRTVTWSSDNATVASVDAGGLVTGLAAGSAQIAASSDDATGTAQIAVVAGANGLAGECDAANAAWIWCDDFEQDRLSSYFEYGRADGSFERRASVGVEGSHGMVARWAQGQVHAGNFKLAFGQAPSSYFRAVDAGTAKYREVYWRHYIRYQPGWVGGGGDKLSRATVFADGNWAQAMIAHVWSGGGSQTHDYLVIDPASGTDAQGNLQTATYNDFGNLRWLGAARGTTPIFDGNHVGQWYCLEAHVRLNDAGQSNGVFELWVDGTLEAQRTGLNWVGSYQQYGLNALFIENYWNQGSPAAQERYFDNFVVSTQRIGCSTSDVTNPPPPPPDQPAPVASVTVSPASLSLQVGATSQLRADVLDASGNALTDRATSWTSSNSAVATVGSDGLVTAVGTGSAVITATSEGKSGSAQISVTAADPPPPPPDAGAHPNEPDGFVRFAENAWNFLPTSWSTSGDGILDGGWKVSYLQNLAIVQDGTAPVSPEGVLRVTLRTTLPGGSGPTIMRGWDSPDGSTYRKKKAAYVSWWFRLGENGGTIPNHYNCFKFSYFSVRVPGGGLTPLAFDFMGGGRPHNVEVSDFPFALFSQDNSGMPTAWSRYATKRVKTGQWNHFEFLFYLNDVGSANGKLRLWVNGELIMNHDDLIYVDAARPWGFSGLVYNPVWGCGGSSPARDWHFYTDHIYMSGIEQ